jgi:hypothetical protein
MTSSRFTRTPRILLGALLATGLVACGGGNDAGSTQVKPGNSVPTLAANGTAIDQGMRFGRDQWPEGPTASGGHGAPVDNVNCLANEDYHIHSHLSIIKDGALLAIPAHIGLSGCAYEMHTHDNSGIIHVETAAYRRFTLGQFFAVWGQPFSIANVAGLTGEPVSVFLVDGLSVVKYSGDLNEIEMFPHRDIVIVIGAIPAEIARYTWPADL